MWIVAVNDLEHPYIRDFETYEDAKDYYERWNADQVFLAEVKEMKQNHEH